MKILGIMDIIREFSALNEWRKTGIAVVLCALLAGLAACLGLWPLVITFGGLAGFFLIFGPMVFGF